MPDTEKPVLYLIDGTAYVYRAYHAIRRLTNSRGLPTNAAFGFARMLLKLMQERSPEYTILFFDAKGLTFRHRMYREYKANRPPMPEDMKLQLPYIRDIVRGFGIPMIEKEGYEADDLIGTAARLAAQDGFQVVVVTGDKDFLQILSDAVSIWDPMKDRMLDTGHVYREFGVAPAQMVDVMGFSGDSADNVPGVPGVGPKTAADLVRSFGDMQAVYDRIEQVSKKHLKEKLLENREQAFLSRELVRICRDAPFVFDPDQCRILPPDTDALGTLFKELEFRQLQRMFPVVGENRMKNYRAVTRLEELEDLVKELETAAIFALDTETSSPHPMLAEIVGLSFATRPDAACYIPCGHDYEDAPPQIPLAAVLERLRPLLESPAHAKIGQNIKYDWIVLARNGIELAGVVFDTMIASYLIDPSKRAHNLDQIALDFLNYKTTTYQEVAGKGKEARPFSKVVLEKAVPYACEDADVTLMAKNVLAEHLERSGLTDLMDQVEMPLVPVLKNMEQRGIRIDVEGLREFSGKLQVRLDDLENKIHEMAGEVFNIHSSQQLGRILFEELNLPVQKKTQKKTGYSTDVDVLTTLSQYHELPACVLAHRSLRKLKSTYADALVELVNEKTGRIHTSYNQTVTATGRLSSSDPNLQNIPIRTGDGLEIRKAFLPKNGWRMLAADYSQVELRILAHFSQDPILLEAFQKDEDIHLRTANEVFQTLPGMITPDLRRQAKTINFGIIYGMRPFGLARQLGISQKMAKSYIEHYFRRYKGVKSYMEHTVETAARTGKTETLLGRIRMLPDILSSNRTVREFAERTAINTPIQGSAADLIKLAMIRIDREIRERRLQAAMLLSVHDEIVFEVPPEELDVLTDMVRHTMETVWALSVPLKVNIATGGNWAEAH